MSPKTLRSDSELLDWLAAKTNDRRVFLDGAGWIMLDRQSISDAMDEEAQEVHVT